MANDPELEREIGNLKELVFARFDAEEKARVIQVTELERRLNDLNHAHQNMLADRALFVRVDIHDRFYQEYREWSQRVDKVMATQAGRSAAYVSLIGILFIALQIFLRYWK